MPENKMADKNFKKWFGQSHVVDDAGEPMVVYHSATADFTQFKRSRKDIGMHFGTAGQAEDRFLIKQNDDPYGTTLGRIVACTLPVFLSIERPLRLPDLGDWDRDNLMGNLPDEFTIPEKVACKTLAEIRDLIRSHGYDGVVYANDREAAGAHPLRLAKIKAFSQLMNAFPKTAGNYSDEQKTSKEYLAYLAAIAAKNAFMKANTQDSWIALEPGQIKSAIANSGFYNRKSRDITDTKKAQSSQVLIANDRLSRLEKSNQAIVFVASLAQKNHSPSQNP